MVAAGTIKLEIVDGADHSFRDFYTGYLVERTIEFINDKHSMTAVIYPATCDA